MRKGTERENRYFRFLRRLRAGGRSNMYGAIPYLAAAFGCDRSEAFRIVCEWIDAEAALAPEAERAAPRRTPVMGVAIDREPSLFDAPPPASQPPARTPAPASPRRAGAKATRPAPGQGKAGRGGKSAILPPKAPAHAAVAKKAGRKRKPSRRKAA